MTAPAKGRSALPRVARPWITVKEAATYAGVGVDAIYAACASGSLKHSRLGHSTIRLRLEWVDAWLESHVRQPV